MAISYRVVLMKFVPFLSFADFKLACRATKNVCAVRFELPVVPALHSNYV
jgi:hypothetical protein